MKEAIKMFFYMIWYLIKRPFVKFNTFLIHISKPKVILNFFWILTITALCLDNVIEFLFWLKPNFSNIFFIIFLVFTIFIYLWKHADKENGEPWKKEYRAWQEKKVKQYTETKV